MATTNELLDKIVEKVKGEEKKEKTIKKEEKEIVLDKNASMEELMQASEMEFLKKPLFPVFCKRIQKKKTRWKTKKTIK